MQIVSYLSKSRHGVFYFRWPLPGGGHQSTRATLRLSLGVRCPKQAGELARYLASCGATLARSGVLKQMRYDELRDRVHAHFKTQLAAYKDRISATGPLTEKDLVPLRGSGMLAEGPSENFWDMVAPDGTDAFLRVFCEASGFPEAEAKANSVLLLEEIKIAFRDMLAALGEHQTRLGQYDYSGEAIPSASSTVEKLTTQKPSISLVKAINEYLEENRNANSWGTTTFDKKEAHLSTLVEVLGSEWQTRFGTDQDVIDVKRIIAALPKNRQKMPATRNLGILDAIAVVGVAKIDTVTVNHYLSSFKSFFDWVVTNRYADANLFAGMKVGKSVSKSKSVRKEFKKDALKAMYLELTQNSMGLVRSESHKWATLIGMFTGARLNEICQLELEDILKDGETWYFNMTDEGDNHKRLKTAASHRKVPIHSELLHLGLLQYRDKIAATRAVRMFPDYSYEERGGYGRPLSRWFNDVFLVKMDLKSKQLVFHSFRHTMVNALAQANVQEPIYQCIVGHERKGVTQQVYNQGGFTVSQLKDAIELFSIGHSVTA